MSVTLKTESNHINPLQELLVEELRDLLHAEGQLVAALPKMAEAAHHPKLQEAFLKHLQQTEGHIERLKTAFELLGEKAQPKPCKAMMGLVEEGQETPELVNQYFDDSTGMGDRGEPNARGPWNEGGDWELVEAPAFKEVDSEEKGTRQTGDGAVGRGKRSVLTQ